MSSAVKVLDKEFVPYLSADQISARVSEIGQQISRDYAGKTPLFLSILNGSFMFSSDLFKALSINAEICFVKLASYEGTSSTGVIKTTIGLDREITNRDLIIIEDIVDTGKTMSHLMEELKAKRPASIRLVTLLHKVEATTYPVQIDYCCFSIPNKFVLGYGLDYDQLGRNLPFLYQLKED